MSGIVINGIDAALRRSIVSFGPEPSSAIMSSGPTDNTPSGDRARIYPTFGNSFTSTGYIEVLSRATSLSCSPNAYTISVTDPPMETTRLGPLLLEPAKALFNVKRARQNANLGIVILNDTLSQCCNISLPSSLLNT